MPLLGQRVATAARRANFVEHLKSMGEGAPCVPWPWSKRAAGAGAYTRISDGKGNGASISAHRWVWIQLNGPVPDGYEVCHNCPGGDDPSCCRPSHLWLGSHAANIQDAYAKGRMHGNVKNHPIGEAHHSTPLTAADVYRIRRLAGSKRGVQRQLARELGVSPAAITSIVKRRSWKHLPEETDQPTQDPAAQA